MVIHTNYPVLFVFSKELYTTLSIYTFYLDFYILLCYYIYVTTRGTIVSAM